MPGKSVRQPLAMHCKTNIARYTATTLCTQHFVILYYSGEKWDCGSPNCGLSSQHAHKNARNCPCPRVRGGEGVVADACWLTTQLLQTYRERRKVLNLIQEPCDNCKEAALAARVRRR